MGAKTDNRIQRQREKKLVAKLRTIEKKLDAIFKDLESWSDEKISMKYGAFFKLPGIVRSLIEKHQP